MTIIAGIFARDPSVRIPHSAIASLRSHISRDPSDTVQAYADPRVLLLKVDIGAYGDSGWVEDDAGRVSLLAGEPLLAGHDSSHHPSRSADLGLLHWKGSTGDWTPLASARGVFCAAHYSPEAHRLTLVTDKLGIRALYFWLDQHYAVFASALRILERVPLVPKVMDLRGVTEEITLGVPLGSRTAFLGIEAIAPAEVVQISGSAVARHRYWSWDGIQPRDRSPRQNLQMVWERFSAAMDCRLGGDRGAVAALSGGMDSRCVVAALRNRSVRVRTFNFGLPGTQDYVLGARIAAVLGTEHDERPMRLDEEIRFPTLIAANWRQSQERRPVEAEHPRLIWTGDGGSVALGYVFQTRSMIDALRAGDEPRAIGEYLRQQGAFPAARLLQPDIRDAVVQVPADGMMEEIAGINCQDPGRRLHLFLLLDDQRHHLASHFEDIDLNRLELVTPLFDSDLHAAMLEIPVDDCLYHAFYTRWMEFFRPLATSVPWQTYPGHVPCPLPTPRGLTGQWDVMRVRSFRQLRRRGILRQANVLLQADPFPHDLLRREIVTAAKWMQWLGAGDYAYIIRHATGYHEYWTRAGGRWSPPTHHPRATVRTSSPNQAATAQ